MPCRWRYSAALRLGGGAEICWKWSSSVEAIEVLKGMGTKVTATSRRIPFAFLFQLFRNFQTISEDLRLLCKESLFFNLKGASYSFERHWSFPALCPLKASKIPSLQPLPVIPFFSLLGLHTKTPLNPLEDMYTVHCTLYIASFSLSLYAYYAYVSIEVHIYIYVLYVFVCSTVCIHIDRHMYGIYYYTRYIPSYSFTCSLWHLPQ